jgi:transposase
MAYVGIDCAKATFEGALPQTKSYQVVKFDNTEEGFAHLLNQLPEGAHCVMEADPRCMASGQQVQVLTIADSLPSYIKNRYLSW